MIEWIVAAAVEPMKCPPMRRVAWLVAAGCLLVLASCASPPEPAANDEPLTTDADIYTRLSELPRHYEGTFIWDEGGETQKLEVWFETVRVSDEGKVWVAEGRGVYRTYQVTEIDIRARIDPEDGEFRMWESNPDKSNFETEGVHVGEISDDFRQVNATWNGDDGNLGDLELRAVERPDAADDL